MATIKDIAARSGYSIATVSRVLNKQRNVDKKIQEKILECAEELNYKPNFLGQLLRTQNSKLVICVIPNIAHGMIYDPFNAMQTRLHQEGYQLLLYPSETGKEYKQNLLSMLESGLISGVIFIAPFMDNEELFQLNQEYPLVQQSEYTEEVKTAIVAIDYAEAFKEGMQYLMKNGHSRIAHLTFSQNMLSTRKKLAGYKCALEEAGIPFDPELVINTVPSTQGSTDKAVRHLMQLERKPTAIICASDNIASQCIKALQHMGLEVPRDCSVMGFDNSALSSVITPALTTVGASLTLMGKRTVDLLLSQIKTGEKTNEKILIPHNLYIRDSVCSI